MLRDLQKISHFSFFYHETNLDNSCFFDLYLFDDLTMITSCPFDLFAFCHLDCHDSLFRIFFSSNHISLFYHSSFFQVHYHFSTTQYSNNLHHVSNHEVNLFHVHIYIKSLVFCILLFRMTSKVLSYKSLEDLSII